MRTNEIFARISYDAEHLQRLGVSESDITIHLSPALYNRLQAPNIDIVSFPLHDTLFGYPVRLSLGGKKDEWFVSATHGIATKEDT